MDVGYAMKYRPVTLTKDYIGERIKNTVLNRFKEGNHYPNTIMVHGTLGCGKTSVTRLISKEYCCISKVDGYACGKCAVCLDIEERLIKRGLEIEGVQEIDLTANNGKKDIENILADAELPPMYPYKYKILILDECHKATDHAQQRLLKITEEPPKHLVFIFCTTNPEKVLPTLRSRCQLEMEVTKPSIDDLVDRMLYVAEQEKLKVTREALVAIAKNKKRIPRACLSMLEDVAVEYGGVVNISNVRDKLSAVSYDIYMEYYRCANKSLESILEFVVKIDETVGLDKFMSGLRRFTIDVINIRHGIGIDEHPPEFIKSAKDFFYSYSMVETDMLLQILEYASKLTSNDKDTHELVMITTALRIGKIKVLTDLSNTTGDVHRENAKSIKEHRNRLEEEKLKSINIKKNDSDSALMEAVFGNHITEVVGVDLQIDENDVHDLSDVDDDMLEGNKREERDDDVLTEDDILKEFGLS